MIFSWKRKKRLPRTRAWGRASERARPRRDKEFLACPTSFRSGSMKWKSIKRIENRNWTSPEQKRVRSSPMRNLGMRMRGSGEASIWNGGSSKRATLIRIEPPWILIKTSLNSLNANNRREYRLSDALFDKGQCEVVDLKEGLERIKEKKNNKSWQKR